MTDEGPRRVVNTYRLQMHAGFTFEDAARIVPYLADLGVTHLYLSPITTAAPGSTHGYDVTDPTQLNPELGGDEGYRSLVRAQREHGLGQVIDIVPNHMGIAPGSGNPYWQDVLRHGRASRYAGVFDIDWDALDGRVVLPLLGDDLDAAIAHGEIEVDEDAEEVRYYETRLPLAPGSLEAWREADRSPSAVRALLDAQHYSLEFWRTGQARLNYRRFFAIDDLIGIHTETPEVFDLAHRLALSLFEDGSVDGLRVDHPDGLHDPEEYLARLAESSDECYVVVEKILAGEEALPDAWRTDGTTGYEFMNAATRVLVDPAPEDAFTAIYDRIAGEPQMYRDIEDGCRRYVVEQTLGAPFTALADRLFEAARDALGGIPQETFVEAVMTLLAHLDRYRTYHRRDALDPAAPGVIRRAREGAQATGEIDPAALERAAALLAAPPEGPAREVVMRIQQVMPAVQAKGLEDRAFYRYRRLLALNEVGGEPSSFGERTEAFHERMAREAAGWPQRMLSTATHDHKRGEDVRARLGALTEFPEEWDDLVSRAFDAIEQAQRDLARRAAPTDVYLLLQTVVGTRSAGMATGRDERDYAERIQDYMLKALREAGERTDWIDQDTDYEEAVTALVQRALVEGSRFLEVVDPFVARLAPVGAVNSLSQVLLRTTCPGVTDTYQGNELWDLSLVDPDNRRPVDFDARSRLLQEPREMTAIIEDWRSGAVKAHVLSRALRTRRDHASLFLNGAYVPLNARGEHAEHVIAFARRAEGQWAVALAARLSRAVNAGSGFWQPAWDDTNVALPSGAPRRWRDVLSGRTVEARPELRLGAALGVLPVALLVAEE